MGDFGTTSLAILGLLSMRPMSGYELTAFADRTIGHFWPIHRSLVYRELGRLEGAGCVLGTDVAQERVPDKRIYELTQSGSNMLDSWLTTPGFERARYKNEFLVKFFFASRMDPAWLRDLLDDYRATLKVDLADLQAIVEKTKAIPGSLFGRLSALHGIRTYEALLLWIADVEDILREESGESITEERAKSPSDAERRRGEGT